MAITFSQWQKDIAEFEAAQTSFALSFAKTDIAKSILDFQSSMASMSSGAAQLAIQSCVLPVNGNLARCMNAVSRAALSVSRPLLELQSQLDRMSEQTNYHIPPYHPQVSLPPSPQHHTTIVINIITDPSLFTDEDEE